MQHDREAQIRQKAHDLWIAEGKPAGQEARHWKEAEESLGQSLPIERAQDLDYKGKQHPRREAWGRPGAADECGGTPAGSSSRNLE
ncbi:hypothetical protein HNP46_001014 [Pseudomonas nitritireducens]|uniref:DUF2934 domain-containing protein n=1 Tax=Pseudomonas nitroreducens TaxID=46680 RepID=A0A7W7NZ71_PSENT|nr:DUF2934 domain-containing protein [Pseudomonas nitritireducens]MBB4862176.1 hypothetical protein [Pseudomonas nitritireducens]